MLSKILRLALSVGLLARVAWRTDWAKFQAGFADLRWEYWIAAAGVLVLAQVASAWRWKLLADRMGLERSLSQLTSYYFIGMFFNLVLPTSVGGDVVRAWYLGGKAGKRLPAFASVVLDRLSGLLVLVAIACAAVTLSPTVLPGWITTSAWTVAGCGVMGLLGMQAWAWLGWPIPARLAPLVSAFGLLRRPRLVASTLLLSVVVQAANVLIVWLVGEALGARVPASYYWVVVPMVTLLTLLPISVNGMGVREEAMVLFLAQVGVGESTALTLSLLWFAVHASVSLAGGVVYMLGRFPKPANAPNQEVSRGSLGGDSSQGRTGQHRHAA